MNTTTGATAVSSAQSSSLLVIAAGPAVVTWDCHRGAALALEEPSNSNSNWKPDSSILRTFHPFGNTNATASNHQFQHHPNNAPLISDVAWNHNGQVLACCSTLPTSAMESNNNTTLKNTSQQQQNNNIVLTSTHSGSILDAFRHNDPTSGGGTVDAADKSSAASISSSSTNPTNNTSVSSIPSKKSNSISSPTATATCLNFGGKSRYLCIGDDHGGVCLWDLKKQSRVRQFLSKSVKSNTTNHSKSLPIVQACLDPTATYVCALSAQHLTLYQLRQANLASQWASSCYTSNNNTVSDSWNSGMNAKLSAAAGSSSGWHQFKFSPLQPSLLALGDSAGRIQLHTSIE